MANFRFKVQVANRYTYLENGVELEFLLLKLLGDKKQPVALEDIVISLEKAPKEDEQQWWDMEQ